MRRRFGGTRAMNVVKKVAKTVRRPAIFRADSSGPSPLADPEREPFQYEIQQHVLHYLMPGVPSTTEEKIQAVAKIGHMCWTGGQNATQFATKNYLSLLKSLLDTKEPPHTPLRLQVVKSLSEICGTLTLTQDLARIQSVLESVIDFMSEGDDECVRWCLHTLFYLVCNNEASQSEAAHHTRFEAGIVRGLGLDWEGWEHNEARELAHMCRLDHLLN